MLCSEVIERVAKIISLISRHTCTTCTLGIYATEPVEYDHARCGCWQTSPSPSLNYAGEGGKDLATKHSLLLQQPIRVILCTHFLMPRTSLCWRRKEVCRTSRLLTNAHFCLCTSLSPHYNTSPLSKVVFYSINSLLLCMLARAHLFVHTSLCLWHSKAQGSVREEWP